jgi:uncharacterized protein YjiS (DUF1127 family)
MTYAPAFMTAREATVPGLRPTPSPIARAMSAWRAAHARRQTLRDYKKLLTVEEHLLSDIGLTRNDIRRAIVECQRAR